MKKKQFFFKKQYEPIAYLVFGLYIATLFMNLTAVFQLYPQVTFLVKGIRILCYVFFLFKILYDWYFGEKITYPMIFLAVLSLLVCLASHKNDLLYLTLVFFAYKNMNVKRLINVSYAVNLALFVFWVSGAILKVFPNWIFKRGSLNRYSLGFIYPNVMMGVFLAIVLMNFYLKKKEASWASLGMFFLLNTLLFYLTNSRMSFYLVSAILLVQGLLKWEKLEKMILYLGRRKWVKYGLMALPSFFFIATLTLSFCYTPTNPVHKKLNAVLSNRLVLSNSALKDYQMTLFGQNIKWNGWGGYGYVKQEEEVPFVYNFVDTSYLKCLLDYGMIVMFVILVMYTLLLKKAIDHQDIWLVFVVLFLLVWALLEQYIVDLERNCFVLFLMPWLNSFEVKKLSKKRIFEWLKIGGKHEKVRG